MALMVVLTIGSFRILGAPQVGVLEALVRSSGAAIWPGLNLVPWPPKLGSREEWSLHATTTRLVLASVLRAVNRIGRAVGPAVIVTGAL
jgi:hypothetical protein